MTLDELLEWKARNQAAVTSFLHQHHELSGIHFMPPESGEADGAHVEFCLKLEDDAEELEPDIRSEFPGLPFRIGVVDPERAADL